ncbi:transforming growth factor beta activator LRRC32-like [Pyxicephalus adspersus]|uniref:transforming growth factor beta activator LRRC32-like n=1 Tax=Pyxicephalus adspersus TaxID=30357 RepID=UPI003B5A76AF
MPSLGKMHTWGLWAPHFLLIMLCQVTTNPHPVQACVQIPPAMICSHLSLYSVPSSLSNTIRTLDLSHNFLQNLTNSSISNLHNLENLDLHNNHLEVMEVGALNALARLRSLNLASNRLHKHSASNKGVFDGLRSLKTLNLANNSLADESLLCYLSNITTLVGLDLSRNAIVVLVSGMFDGVPWLSELDLSSNFIDEIQSGAFDSLKDLRTLNLAENSIQCISSFDLPQLYFLNLSSNLIEVFLPNDTQELHQLINLDLSHNRLVYFPVLNKFQMVQHINLSGNQIAKFVPSSNMEPWYEVITHLNLSSAIEDSFSWLWNVTDLNLSNNKLATFPWYYLSKMSKLSHLSLARNCLQDLTVDFSAENRTLQSLKVMDLQANSIHFIQHWIFNFLPEIEHINLKNNNIRFCSNLSTRKKKSAINQHDCSMFSDVHNLHYLNLQQNNILQLPPHIFHRTPLISLDVSQNPRLEIQDWALEELSQSLEVFSVNGNGMNDTQMNLPCLQSLKSLDLSNNHLTRLPSSVKCSSINNLDLYNNSLKTLSEITTSDWKENLKNVSISGNPLDCCSLTWLDFLLAAKIHIWDLEKAHCVYAASNISVPVNVTHAYYCHYLTDDRSWKIGIIVLSGSFTLCSLIWYYHKKGERKFCMAFKIRSSKVAPKSPAPTKSFNTDGKQTCFTVSRNGLD